jgi:heme o synthase
MINYYLITKPGIILGNLITVAAGFLLASKGNINFWLFFATLIGLMFIIASGCVFNNYINREVDKKMERTKNRPLVTGLISSRNAIIFGSCLVISGNLILFLYTNFLTVMVADIGFFVYVIPYSFWKCRTVYGTAIGSIAGATPPVVGYCAVSNSFDLGAFLLFAILVMWQMPHFFAIAIYHLEDFVAGEIPVLPIKKGILRTKIHMLVYILAFVLTTSMLTFFNYTGYSFLTVIALLGITWLWLSIKGFQSVNDTLWARSLFRFSLVIIMALSIMISVDCV